MIGAFTRRSFLALPVALAAAPRVRLTNTARDALASVAPDDLGTIEKMNRADRKHLPRLPLLTLPLDNALSPITWCTLPVLLHGFSLDRKAVIVHLPSQQFGAYESGVLNYWDQSAQARQNTPRLPACSN